MQYVGTRQTTKADVIAKARIKTADPSTHSTYPTTNQRQISTYYNNVREDSYIVYATFWIKIITISRNTSIVTDNNMPNTTNRNKDEN
jgi:hypothetical protein